jgi:hypothetical protein
MDDHRCVARTLLHNLGRQRTRSRTGQPGNPADVEGRLRELSSVSRRSSALSVVTDIRGSSPKKASAQGIGHLELRTVGRSFERAVDERLLRAGMLLGRYGRCDINENHIDMPKEVSRVHALLLIIDGSLYVVDTGSSNGIVVGDELVGQVSLSRSCSKMLDMGGLEVIWVYHD